VLETVGPRLAGVKSTWSNSLKRKTAGIEGKGKGKRTSSNARFCALINPLAQTFIGEVNRLQNSAAQGQVRPGQ
jgi:hypothetical protein